MIRNTLAESISWLEVLCTMHQKLVGFLAPIGDKRKAKHPPADEQVGCAGVNVYPVFALSIHHGGWGGGNTSRMAPTETSEHRALWSAAPAVFAFPIRRG